MKVPAHVIKYRNEKGDWVSIPVIYQTAYRAYVDFCKAKGIEPSGIDGFYGAIQLLTNTPFLDNLIQASGGNAPLPLECGGTGGDNNAAARYNLDVYSKEETQLMIDYLIHNALKSIRERLDKCVTEETFNDVLNNTLGDVNLENLKIGYGEELPDAATSDYKIFFKYTD